MIQNVREGFFHQGNLVGFGRYFDAFDSHIFVGYFDQNNNDTYGIDSKADGKGIYYSESAQIIRKGVYS